MIRIVAAAAIAAAGLGLTASAYGQAGDQMSFFVSSTGSGKGADLGGLTGADAHCARLASAAGSTRKQWRAYLSAAAAGAQPDVNARDRIGKGPWRNAKGVVIANDLTSLHSAAVNINAETALSEKGAPIPGRGATPNLHDILTGTALDGTLSKAADGTPQTCGNWTSSSGGTAMVGHHDRMSLQPGLSPWNAAHPSRGCSQSDLQGTGGGGLIYCFAAD